MQPIEIPAAAPAPLRLPRPPAGLRRLAHNPIPVREGVRYWSGPLEDTNFLADSQTYLAGFDGYIANGAGHWFAKRHGGELGGPVAYFCAAYGLHRSGGVYSC